MFQRAVVAFEAIPLLLFLLAAVVFVRHRKQILAAMVLSPIPPIP